MPNHWESSARPLFVRTVFVNGNRHAILFEEDPHVRYGNSPFKKISRSNSPLSFISDLSLTSSESQDSNSDEKVIKLRRSSQQQQQQGKDLSSELQSCLIKLRLASGNLANRSKSDEEKCSYNSKETEENQKEVSRQKKHKWKREKSCKRRHCGSFQEESEDSKIQRQQKDKESSCYFYNYESNKRKKNYCVVKISSQPPQFTLRCTCENKFGENHKCKGFPSGRNSMLISATIHNLCMTNKKDKLFEEKLDGPFPRDTSDSFDFYWNTYLTRSYYNSLSERVLQWLDLASKKKKQKQKFNATTDEGDILNSIERIFSGKTFINENIKTENSDNRQSDKELIKSKDTLESNTHEENFESEVAGASSLKPFLSKFIPQQLIEKGDEKIILNSSEIDPTPSEILTKGCIIQQPDNQNSTKSPLKIQDLLLDYNFRKKFDISFGKKSTRKTREVRDFLKFSKTHREFGGGADSTEEDENLTKTQLHNFEKKMYKKSHKYDPTICHCDGSSDIYADKIRNQLLSERIPEAKQKSINKLNFTRGKSVLIQNLLSSQQNEEISAVRSEKIVWESEKGTGRLQLHIFMPSLLIRESSEDSTSECENVFNL